MLGWSMGCIMVPRSVNAWSDCTRGSMVVDSEAWERAAAAQLSR